MDHLCFCVLCFHTLASVHCCLVVTCWERADLLALGGDVYFIFVTFSCGILGQVWYLIVSFLIFVVFHTFKKVLYKFITIGSFICLYLPQS